MEHNILTEIKFDGSRFHGWQIQNNSYTVQECFQDALQKILGCSCDIKACSRTDSGVHANSFYISFKTQNKIHPENLTNALNHFLPASVVCLSSREVPIDFHARYSCRGKQYVYKILNSKLRDPFLEGRVLHYWRPIDENLLSIAASHFIGTQDFSALCTMDKRYRGNLTRTVSESRVDREGDMVYFTVTADGFLYNMVRIMVGTLLRVQENQISEESLPYIIKSKERSKAGPTAPACGLYLNHVYYDFERSMADE
jgi:tRNA pseudouridine38-40 synthase